MRTNYKDVVILLKQPYDSTMSYPRPTLTTPWHPPPTLTSSQPRHHCYEGNYVCFTGCLPLTPFWKCRFSLLGLLLSQMSKQRSFLCASNCRKMYVTDYVYIFIIVNISHYYELYYSYLLYVALVFGWLILRGNEE